MQFFRYNDSQSVHRSLCKSVFFFLLLPKVFLPGNIQTFFWQQQIHHWNSFAFLCSPHCHFCAVSKRILSVSEKCSAFIEKGAFWLVENTNSISAHIFSSWILCGTQLLLLLLFKSGFVHEFTFECIRMAFLTVKSISLLFPPHQCTDKVLWVFFFVLSDPSVYMLRIRNEITSENRLAHHANEVLHLTKWLFQFETVSFTTVYYYVCVCHCVTVQKFFFPFWFLLHAIHANFQSYPFP